MDKKKLEKYLHELIEYTAWYLQLEIPEDLPLPDLSVPLADRTMYTKEFIPEDERYGFYGIPGFYGGVNYRYVGDTLKCVSFCRVCGGSETEYRITEDGIEIVAYGESFTEADDSVRERFKETFQQYKESC